MIRASLVAYYDIFASIIYQSLHVGNRAYIVSGSAYNVLQLM